MEEVAHLKSCRAGADHTVVVVTGSGAGLWSEQVQKSNKERDYERQYGDGSAGHRASAIVSVTKLADKNLTRTKLPMMYKLK